MGERSTVTPATALTVLVSDAGAVRPAQGALCLEHALSAQHEALGRAYGALTLVRRAAAEDLVRALGEIASLPDPSWPTYEACRDQAWTRFVTQEATAEYVGAPEEGAACETPSGATLLRVQYAAAKLAGIAAALGANLRLSPVTPKALPGLRTGWLRTWNVGVDPGQPMAHLCGKTCDTAPYLKDAYQYAAAELCSSLADLLETADADIPMRMLPAHLLARVDFLCANTHVEGMRIGHAESRLQAINKARQSAARWLQSNGYQAVSFGDSRAEVELTEDLVEWFARAFEHLLVTSTTAVLSEDEALFVASLWADAQSEPAKAVFPADRSLQRFDYPDRPIYKELIRVLSSCWGESVLEPLPAQDLAVTLCLLDAAGAGSRHDRLPDDPEPSGQLLVDSGLGGGVELAIARIANEPAFPLAIRRLFSRFRVLVPTWERRRDTNRQHLYSPGWHAVDYEVVAGQCQERDRRAFEKKDDPWSDGMSLVVVKTHGAPYLGLADASRLIASEDQHSSGFLSELVADVPVSGQGSALYQHFKSSNLEVIGFNPQSERCRMDLYALLGTMHRTREYLHDGAGTLTVRYTDAAEEGLFISLARRAGLDLVAATRSAESEIRNMSTDGRTDLAALGGGR